VEGDKIGYKLVGWYKENYRSLPWRQTIDPYKIWLSEIILQQTRVAQGLPYYERFLERFPDIRVLAAASETEVLRLWQGLGYYSRARNLHATARFIVENLDGIFPDTYEKLVQLKGIGDYTASAIASFAFNEQTPVVDGNVFRVLARYYGIQKDIADSDARRVFREAAKASMPVGQAAIFNQAVMEFGALQCVPGMPDCASCVLHTTCHAFAHKAQLQLPVKTRKTKIKQRTIHYLVLRSPEGLALRERRGRDIWKGLFDFPSFDDQLPEDLSSLLPKEWSQAKPVFSAGPIKHILSHQLLSLHYWIVDLPEALTLPEGVRWFSPAAVSDLPKPQPIHIYLQEIL